MDRTETVAYIAGPYRDSSHYHVERNIRAAEAVAVRVAGAGATFLCPHTMTRAMEGVRDDAYWLDATLELMRRCDCVVLADDWWGSEGANNEINEARRLGIPVFESDEDGFVEFLIWLIERSNNDVPSTTAACDGKGCCGDGSKGCP